MPPKLFGDDDGGEEDVSTLEIDKEYARRLEYNRKREDLQRYEELKQRGVEEDSDKEEKKIKSYDEEQDELRKAVSDAMEIENDEDGEELLKETEKKGDDDDDMEVDEELVKKAGEYFGGGDGELDEKNKFLKDYLLNHRWKEKEKRAVIDEAELDELEDDEDAVEIQEEYESNYRHEENAGEIVMGYSRKVEGSEGDECQLNAKDVDDEFDPEEYDKMMKAVFDDKYYDEEDSGLSSDEDGEKPDFDKEDELLGLPKDWDVIQGGDGFTAAREMALKQKEIADTGAEPASSAAEEGEGEASKLSRKAKRRRRQAEKKLPPSRMAAYGKPQ
ncbi:unnamed protein product [Arabis nemorensis]|uniref:Kri1-like C-terminal domain-containing protein n=1 Tax=Arabis nemorensis TaxID=586526 RepID=A0A565BG18_9BRAS|nr:unnamed protein product [Arabis nemorensis]